MIDRLRAELNSIVVKPDEVLVVALPGIPEMTPSVADEVLGALNEAGLRGRCVVLIGDVQLATAPASPA